MRLSSAVVTKLAAALVLTIMVFLPISSQAATEVDYTGNTATGIEDLECAGAEGVFYDVTFVFDVGTAVYGEPPGDFPFETLPDGTTREEGTFALSRCIQNALNAAPVAITRVGPQNNSYFLIAVGEDREEPGTPWFYGVFESRYYDTADPEIQRPPETWVPADNFSIELFPPDPGFNPIDYEGIPFGARGVPQDVEYSWAEVEPVQDDPPEVSIGGSVTGLDREDSGLVLQNNGTEDERITADGDFTFATPVPVGSGYSVTVKTQPSNPAQKCTVARGSGIAPSGGVDDVLVTCVDPPVSDVSDTVFLPAIYFMLGL